MLVCAAASFCNTRSASELSPYAVVQGFLTLVLRDTCPACFPKIPDLEDTKSLQPHLR